MNLPQKRSMHTALSFKNAVEIQKRCYFIADVRAYLVLSFYDFPVSGLIFEEDAIIA